MTLSGRRGVLRCERRLRGPRAPSNSGGFARCAGCPPGGILAAHAPFFSAPTESARRSGRLAWGRRKLWCESAVCELCFSGRRAPPAKVGLRQCSHGAQRPRTGQLPKSGLLGQNGRKGLTAGEGAAQRRVPRGSRWGQERNRLVAPGQQRAAAGLRPGPVRTCPRMRRAWSVASSTHIQDREPDQPGPPSSSPLCTGRHASPSGPLSPPGTGGGADVWVAWGPH